METILSEVLRILLVVVFVGGLLWTLVVMYRIYEIDEQPIRLLRTMQRLGIRPTTAAQLQFARYLPMAVRLCYFCRSKSECDAWSAKRGEATAPPEFCANAAFLYSAINEERQQSAVPATDKKFVANGCA